MEYPGFDVVVIGAGSAGCVLAGQLCQKTNFRVCLVEAGPDYGAMSSGRWPPELLDPRQIPTTHDWGYVEERPDGRIMEEARAKVIGGCSAHNQCAAIWGVPDDYDHWESLGNPDWGYAAIKPFIDRIEKAATASAMDYRGHDGTFPTKPYSDVELAFWQRRFLEAALAIGFPRLVDLSSPLPEEGVAPVHANVKDSVRWNTAFAFLDPIRGHPNLTILSKTLADRLIVERGTATTLVAHSDDGVFEIPGRHFVLCAGTYGSPAILMRSGIGPADHLEALDIAVQLNLAGVGRNLHDHPGISIQYEPGLEAQQALVNDLARGQLYAGQVMLRTRSTLCKEGFDLHVFAFQPRTDSGKWNFEIFAFHLAPLSRGRVLLRGKYAHQPPRINLGLLSDSEQRDLAVLTEGFHFIRRLAQFAPLVAVIRDEAEPWKSLNDEREVHAYIQAHVTSYAHPVGTCKMGPSSDPSSVVDSSGLVHGTSNIFVADASIMPQIVRANTNLTCLLIGFRMAEWLSSHAGL
jgi:choline dehydrogenase